MQMNSKYLTYHYVNYQNNVIDEFTISKTTEPDNNKGFDKL